MPSWLVASVSENTVTWGMGVVMHCGCRRAVVAACLALHVVALPSCRRSDTVDVEGASPLSSQGAVDPSRPRYESVDDAFRVSFPLPGAPRVLVDPPETVVDGVLAGKQVTRVSYYVAKGDLTFLVEARRLPPGARTQEPEWLEWARTNMRSAAKRMLEERTVSLRGPHGEKVVAVQAHAEMPSGVRVHNAILFYGDRMYAIGAAPVGPADAATYERFLRSFELLDQGKAK